MKDLFIINIVKTTFHNFGYGLSHITSTNVQPIIGYKRLFISSLLFTLFSFNTYSQDIHFIKSYGNSGYDFGRDVKQDLDTGYIATGSSSSFHSGTADAFLLKVDSLGNFKWSYNYGGQETDWGESVVITHDSSYAIGGYTNSFGAGGFDFYLVRADKDGTPLWEKTYGGSDWDRAHSLIQLADSGFVLVGDTYSHGNGNADIYIVRTDKNGNTLWTTTYGGPENDFGNVVILDGDSLVIAGGTESFGGGMQDGIILKYHINGTFGWSKVVGHHKEDYFTSVAIYPSGEYLFSGTRNYNHFANCNCKNDFWFYKTESFGTQLKDTIKIGDDQIGDDIVHDLLIVNNDHIIYGGETTSWGTTDIALGYPDAWIGKLSNNFYPFWIYVNRFGSTNDDQIVALDICYDEGVVGIGNLDYNSIGGANMFISRFGTQNDIISFDIETELVNDIITLSVNEGTGPLDLINVYPTIVNNELNIEGLVNEDRYSIYILDGKIIKQGTISSPKQQINVEELSKGLYIFNLQSQNKSYKFIKN